MKLSWTQAEEMMEQVNEQDLDYNRKRFIVSMILHGLAAGEGEEVADALNRKHWLSFYSEGAHPFFDKNERRPLDPSPGPHGEYVEPKELTASEIEELASIAEREKIQIGE